jgi:hypothetical protein
MRYFAFNQIVKHLRIATRDRFSTETCGFAKANCMPASKAVRPQSKHPRAKIQPGTGRFNYNQKIGRSERTSSERGLSGLQSEMLPVPRLAANPTLTTPGKTP